MIIDGKIGINKSTIIKFILLPYLALVIIHVLMALQMELPIVVPDEFTYLAKASNIAGCAEVSIPKAGTMPTGFGYSLIIAPAFMLFNNPISIYKAALVINSIISASMYIWIFIFLKQFFNSGDKKAFAISLLTCLYPAYLLQSNMAWTDAVTPALFSALIVSFYFLINKPNIGSSLLFSTLTVLLFAVHVRFIPIPIIAILFLIAIVQKGIIPKKYVLLSIISIFLLSIISMSYGQGLNLQISGGEYSDSILFENIINRIDILLFAIAVIGLFVFRRSLLLFAGTSIASLSAAVLLGGSFNTKIVSIPIIIFFISFYIFYSVKYQISMKRLSMLVTLNILTFLLSFLLFPGFGAFFDYLGFLYYLNISASGKLYYIFTATLGLSFVGVAWLAVAVWKQTWLKPELILKEKKNISLLFLLLCAVGLFLIITNEIIYDVSSIRPDRLFYGRYIESFAAPFIAAGLFYLFNTARKHSGKIIYLSSALFIIIAVLLLIFYGNYIESEPAFRNFLSFFAIRTALGGINIILFSVMSLTGLFLMFLLIKIKLKSLSVFLLALYFVVPSVLTYRYVMQYHQDDRVQKNIIIKELAAIGHADTVFCDLRLRNSPNIFIYRYLLPGTNFLFISAKEKRPGLYISKKDYKGRYNKEAAFLAIEHGGGDCLWYNGATEKDSTIHFPSYFGLNLMDSLITGTRIKGIYDKKWLNGHTTFSFRTNTFERAREIHLLINCTNNEGQELILNIDEQKIFKEHVGPGVWKYIVELEQQTGDLNEITLNLYSDLAENEKGDLIGIRIDTLIFISAENEEKPRDEWVLAAFIGPAKNYDLSAWKPKAGDSLQIPLHFNNSSKDSIFVKTVWRDFALKSIVKSEEPIPLPENSSHRLFYTINAPEKPGKYFLEFEAADSEGNAIKTESRKYLFEILN